MYHSVRHAMYTVAPSATGSVYRFIGVWQQESSQRPQLGNGDGARVLPPAPTSRLQRGKSRKVHRRWTCQRYKALGGGGALVEGDAVAVRGTRWDIETGRVLTRKVDDSHSLRDGA